MEFNEYQKLSTKTAIYPSIVKMVQGELRSQGQGDLADEIFPYLVDTDLNDNLYYAALGLGGEAGEVCNKVKKLMRDNGGVITQKFKDYLKGELGDILWYVAACAREAGLELDEIAEQNVNKLVSRQERGVLQGDGDNR